MARSRRPSVGRTPPGTSGAALARNPFPIIVPCHRVVAANGALTGFSAPGGLATKRRMLEIEGAPGYGQQVLFG
jgi:methylated-DNA-[protein]-cysteine S-methyltransferase